ncbi:uncharacterized protein TNCV_1553421 [Trichonephila clavipes]|nr:uncharacterized protein TNCV_1553421 [Trichonephila clavipes]
MEETRFEQRSYVKIAAHRGKNAMEYHSELGDALGNTALPYRTLARWVYCVVILLHREDHIALYTTPNPVSQKAYDRINAKIADISEALANASMKKAAAEEKIIHRTVNSVVVNSDGTWKTRGHTSLIGVCALIGADCGKVLDMEVMSSYCKGCDSDKGPKLGPKYSAFG